MRTIVLMGLGAMVTLIAVAPARAQDPPVPTIAHRRAAATLCRCTGTMLDAVSERILLREANPGVTLIPGFHRPDAAMVPAPVARAARSVVKVITPFSYRSVPTADFPQLASQIVVKDDSIRRAAFDQHRHCVAENAPSCLIPTSGEIGTGFVIGDGRTVMMSGHVVRDGYLAEQTEIRELVPARTVLPFFIYDANDRLVASPFDSKIVVREVGPADPTLQVEPASDDYISLQLSRPIAPPIPLARRVTTDEPTYAIGFPARTIGGAANGKTAYELLDGTRAPFPDTDGIRQYVSIGNLLKFDPNKIKQFEWRMRKAAPAGIGDHTRIETTTNDGNGGISGGAVVNARGELIGVVALQSLSFGGGALSYLQFTARPKDWPALAR